MSRRSNSCCVGRLSGIRPAALFARAKKEFGTTRDPRETGWILPDGAMLDFSGKRQGGQPGVRHLDHRDINLVYPDRESKKFESVTEGMYDFCERGAVRVDRNSRLFTAMACRPLTSEQRSSMRQMLVGATDAVVEVACPGVSSWDVPNREWGTGAQRFHPDAVINWTAQQAAACTGKKKRRR